jgi:uncharacterized protein (DUF1800 family)
LNGFGLGARIGERDRIGEPRAWLRGQLEGSPPRLEEAGLATTQELGELLRGLRLAAQSGGIPAEARRRIAELGTLEAQAVFAQRVATDRPFAERLVAFWSNHLCVSTVRKIALTGLAGSYERQVIRPNVFGRFEEMVLASAKHPAMLLYLDNAQSIGPDSPAARNLGRNARELGLNENYARELLELHTLGVDGGYTQADVQELARLLTGWTLAGVPDLAARARSNRLQASAGAGESLAFAFRPLLHEPGRKTLLGRAYGEGIEEGERAIRDLCRHPSTARFVATKLVAHFVADTPSPAAVDRIAGVFATTGGDLRAVALELVELPEAWADGARKFRTPQDWLVAALRAYGSPARPQVVVPILRQFRHEFWSPRSPKGYPDTTQDWSDPDSLMNRAELATRLDRRVQAEDRDPRGYLDVVEVGAGDPLRSLLSDPSIDARNRVALAIASPAFQWR